MESAAKIAKILDKVLTFIVTIFLLIMIIYAGYSLWDMNRINNEGFLSDDLLKYKPSGDPEDKSLEELCEINSDVVGWINIKDTNIDYPVVRGKDNLEYVNKNVLGDFSFAGAIFLDSRNEKNLSDSYNLLYGHNMANGAMFGDLNKFDDEDYFERHKEGELYTLTKNYKIEIFSSLKVNTSDCIIFTPGNLDDTAKESLRKYINEKALFTRDIGLTSKDNLIALSTCCNVETNERMIIFGRLEEDN